jgi:ATP-dependent Clp protease ATP-binding subunit ClpA
VFERFTDHARRVVVYAQEESRLLAHDHIGSEHLLLGLLHDGDDPTGQALTAAGVKLEIVRQRVEAPAGRGKKPPSGHIVEQVRSRSRFTGAIAGRQARCGATQRHSWYSRDSWTAFEFIAAVVRAAAYGRGMPCARKQ